MSERESPKPYVASSMFFWYNKLLSKTRSISAERKKNDKQTTLLHYYSDLLPIW